MKNKNRYMKKYVFLVFSVSGLAFGVLSCGSSAQSVEISTPAKITHSEKSIAPSPEKTPQTIDSQLIAAVGNKDADLVKELLGKGASSNAKTEDSQSDYSSSVLLLAVDKGSLPIAEMLLNDGANPNIGGWGMNQFPATPLGSAVLNGNLKIAEVLLKKGANISEPAFMDEPISFIADDEKKIDFLIKHGMNINQKNHFGGTTLTRAIERDDIKLAELLIKNGADINYKRTDRETPYTLAKFYESKDSVALLKKYGAKETDSPLIEFATQKPLSSKKENDLKRTITGKWKKGDVEDCNLESCLDIQFDKTDDNFCVIGNQIFISAYYRLDLKNRRVLIFFKRPTDLGRGGLGMGWDRYDRTKPIATIDISNLEKDEISLKWIGFSYKDMNEVDNIGVEVKQGNYIKYLEQKNF